MAVLDPIQGKKIHGPPSLMPSAGNTSVDCPAWTICPEIIMIWLLIARLLVWALKNSGLLADQTNSLEKNEQNLFQNFNFGFFAMFWHIFKQNFFNGDLPHLWIQELSASFWVH